MRVRRREFILGLAMLADVGRASAQDRMRRIRALIAVRRTGNVLETVLKEKGWIVGRNLQIEYRITGGDTDLTRAYAGELLALQPDVLFAVTNTSMAALHAKHSNIPTVFAWVSDPVGMHYVECFSRPGAPGRGHGNQKGMERHPAGRRHCARADSRSAAYGRQLTGFVK
jgi:putative ABC transport system substrate-binding protein